MVYEIDLCLAYEIDLCLVYEIDLWLVYEIALHNNFSRGAISLILEYWILILNTKEAQYHQNLLIMSVITIDVNQKKSAWFQNKNE